MSAAVRVDPLALLGGVEQRFSALRAAAGSGEPFRDRDAFLLSRDANEVLQSLRPEEGLGEDVGGLAALLHAAYLYWLDGRQMIVVDDAELARRLALSPADRRGPGPRPGSRYVQVPPLRVWGIPVAGAPAEPLDGWFAEGRGPALFVVALFGLHPARAGVTVVDVSGEEPVGLAREDGTPLFAPTLAGGGAAGLASIEGAEELLELAWRMERS